MQALQPDPALGDISLTSQIIWQGQKVKTRAMASLGVRKGERREISIIQEPLPLPTGCQVFNKLAGSSQGPWGLKTIPLTALG